MSKKQLGRPRVAKRKYKQPAFSVRLIGAERKEIEKAITASQEDKSAWIRDALLTKARSS
jgi:hypothetical protein